MAQETNCGDGIDNDGDGLIDCYDDDCQGVGDCEDFFFNPPEPDCGFTPPELDEIELNLLFKTDETRFPIDQRAGVVVGDLDCDGVAELVSRDNNPPRIQIFDGATGELKQSIVTPTTHPFGQLAIADVDGDCMGDIFHVEYTGRLARYEFGNPNAVWRTGNYVGDDVIVSTPQLADINQDGIPEVYVGDRIFDALTGERYADGGGAVNTGGYAGGSNADRFPIYYDLFQPGDPRPDGNGVFGPEAAGMEYIAGNQVWTVDFDPNGGMDNGTFQLAAQYSGPSNLRDGFTSIADINGDGRMDIAVMDAGDVYAWDPYTNEIIGPSYQVPNTGSGGRINIGDFDGDGDVELGFAGRNIYIVRNYIDDDGDNDPNNGTWVTLWQKTGLDDGSQRTGSTLFDFDGNGTVEVVYSEEENLFIYDGPTGMELFRTTSRSGTRTEYPIVADVNGDGTAEIIVTAQERNGPQFSGTGWISVYESANQPWVPARDVWNQHGYNVTNINDDLTVPQFQQNNLAPEFGGRYNNFLVQTAVGGDSSAMVTYPAPDAVIMVDRDGNGDPVIDFSGCPDEILVTLVIDNDGSAPLPASTPISYYDGDPSVEMANLIQSTTLGQQVEAGETVTIQRTIPVGMVTPGSPIYLSVNDPGFPPADLPFEESDFPLTGTPECDYSNNVSFVGNVRCGEMCDNGRDDDGDGLVDEPNLVQTESTGCPGAVLNPITNDSPGGIYSVLGANEIGTTVDQNGVVTLGDNFSGTPVTQTIRYDDGICTEEVTVTTVDDVDPTITCPGNQNLAVDTNCEAFAPDLTGQAQVSDNCTAFPPSGGGGSIDQSPIAGAPLSLGANTITLTAFDRSGNTASCTVTVTVVDQIDPTIACPPDEEVAVDGNCQYTVPDLTGGAAVDDNCSDMANITVAQTPVQGSVRSGDGTTVLVTLTATDEAGNAANCTYTLTLADQTPPTITCPIVGEQTLSNTPDDCTFNLFDYRGQVQRQDNCSGYNQITVVQSPAPGTSITEPGTVTITMTATDAAGNSTTCTFDQVIVDRDPPQLICGQFAPIPPNMGTCDYTVPDVIATSTITDNCGSGTPPLTVTQSPAAGTTFTGLFQNVTVTATDASGNSNSCVTTLLPGEDPPATIVCPADQTLLADGDCFVPLPDYTGQATTDGCGPITVTQAPGPGTPVANTTTVTLTARNSAGVETTCTFSVDVDDITPPTINCPATQTLAVDGTCAVPLPDYTGQASTADNCDPAKGGVMVTQSPGPGTLYTINDSPVTVTLTATDASGNTADCGFTVELMDNQPPTISCPVSPQVDQLDGDCNATLPDFRGQANVSSTCDMSTFTLTQSPAPGTVISGEQIVVVTITAQDAQGNTVSCDFDYQTVDVTPPALTCPADQTGAVDGDCDFVIPDYTALATVADNCSNLAPAPAPNLTLSQTPTPGTVVSGDGTVTTITITATDAAGNTSSCDFDLTLEDTTDPTIVCPADQTRDLDGGCTYVLEDLRGLATLSDNCSAPAAITIEQSPLPASLGLTGPGTQTITLTATDEAGNSKDCTFELTVQDVNPPVVFCPANPTLVVDDACMTTVPDLTGSATAFDNCIGQGPTTITQDVAVGTTLTGDGTTQDVVLTATDANGLTASCTVTITLDDVTPPNVTCPAAADLNLDPTGCQVALPDYITQLTLDDNCTANAALNVQQMPAPGTTLSGANTVQVVTFSVDDGNGNGSSCQFNVTTRDVTDPTVMCPTPGPLTLDGDCQVTLPDFTGQATAMDDCAMTASIVLTQSPGPGTLLTFDGDQRTVTITADDGNGNTANCSFTVVAEDTEMPSIACPADRDEPVSANCDFTLPDYTTEATVMDNCSDPAAITVTQSPAFGTVIAQDQLNVPQTITLTATDAAGNSQICTFAITPVDETVPTIVCPAPQTILLNAANCDAMLGDYTGLATTMDNCSDPAAITVTQDIAPGTIFNGLVPPDTTVVLTATDESGNSATCELSVLIRDEVDPTVDCAAANQTVALDADCNGELPDLIPDLLTDDNCSADALTIIQDPALGAQFGGDGTAVDVTFTVTDGSGNSVNCTATVTFEDQTPPMPVDCPADQDLNVDDSCPVPLPDYTPSATVLDNCRAQADIVVTQSPLPGTMVMGPGTIITITLTADDGNGNTADCTFDVTLVDEDALDLTCPGGQIVIASDDNCDGELEDYLSLVTAVNQCMVPAAGATLTQSPPAGTVLTLAELDVPQTVTVTGMDGNGNTSMCTFEVTLVDTLAPMVTCPADVDRSFDGACQFVLPDYTGDATLSDNCAAETALIVTQDPPPGAGFLGPDATQVVTLTATDPSGNRAQCTFNLTVADNQPPLVTCPEPDTLFTNVDCEVTIGDYTGMAVTDDNCTPENELVVVQDPPPGTVISGHLTNQTITITATDGSGNSASCDFTVTAVDTVTPMVVCQGDQIIRPDANCDALIPDYRGGAKVTDNCADEGMITLTQRPAPGTVLNGEGDAAQITIVADDGNGNRDSCTFIVTVEDDVPPTIACPADRTIDLDANCEYDLEDLRPEATVLDNCTDAGAILVSQNVGIGTTFSGDDTQIVVTLTADDGNGNTTQCLTTITLEDTADPTIICPTDQTVFLDAGCTARVPDYRQANVDDNCTVPTDITVTQLPAAGTVLMNDGTTRTVTLTADDGNGNTADCSFVLTLRDNTPPTITCPDDQLVFVDGSCETALADYVPLATAADNCTTDPATAQNPAPGTMTDTLGVRTVTLTTDDGNGNTTSCTFTVEVADNTPPELTCPPASVIAADADCSVSLADYRDSIMVSDNCGPLSAEMGALTLVQSPVATTEISGLGAEQTVTIIATDPSGNQTDCEIIVMLADTTRPTIVCPNDTTLAVDDACAALVPDYTVLPEVADNCDGTGNVTVTQSPVPGTMVADEASLLMVTLTATDPSGNSISCDFAVQLIDTLPPTIDCPINTTETLDGNCSFDLADYRPLAAATDNCSATAEITFEQRPAPGTVFTGDSTVISVTLIATDQSGNRDSCVFDVTLDDVTSPVVASCPGDTTVFVDGACAYDISDFWAGTTATATDNCTPTGTTATTATGDQLVYTQTPAVGDQFTGGTTTQTVTLTADDGNGNTASCSFVLSLSDTVAPVITVCPADTVANPNADCEFALEDYTPRAQATDNCEQDGLITFSQSPAPGTVIDGQGAMQEITITATDANGNTTSCTFDLILADTTSPTIVCPPVQAQLVDADCSVILDDYTGLAVVDDNCTAPGTIVVTQADPAGTVYTGVQTRTVTLTADDGNGNTATCTFDVSIEDEIDPVLSCPATSVIPADAACTVAIVDYRDSVMVTDNCDAFPPSGAGGGITLTQDVAVGTTIDGLGATLDVTITAEDQSGNTDQCVITVELIDTIRPVLTCASDTVLGVDASCAAVVPDYRGEAGATDNCNDPAGITFAQTPPPGTPLDTEGTVQTVTITATDASGNETSCTFDVTLIDTIPPAVVCPPDDVISVDGGCEIMLADYTAGAQPTDNCSDPADISLSQDPPPGTTLSGDGTTQTVTVTATDESGNTATCTLTVTLEDSTEPMISCPADQELTADEDCEVPIPDYTGDATVSSMCDQGNGIVVTQNPAPGTLIAGHNTSETITLTATDASGNSASCDFTVTLIDRTAPTIIDCPADTIGDVNAACAFGLPDYWAEKAVTATDNCQSTGVVSGIVNNGNQMLYTQDPPPGTVLSSGMGTQTITLTADDRNGNTVSCQFVLTLRDTIRPVITECPADTVASPDANCAFVLEDYTGRAAASDNCEQDGAIVFTQSPAAGTTISGDETVQEITITATDANGNASSCSFELMLADTTSPTITCPAPQTELVNAVCQTAIEDYTALALTDDNCDAASVTVTQSPAPGTVFSGVQTQTITLTADDGNGNTTPCTFELSVEDEIDPELSCPDQSVIPADADCEVSIVSYLDSVSVTDNCEVASDIMLDQDVVVGTTINGLGATLDVTITATDLSGNTDQCVIEVVLIDTIRPQLTCVPDTILGADAGCSAVLPDYRTVASATDNCNAPGEITLTQTPAAGSVYSDEATSVDVTIRATDASGNFTECTFNVQLVDTIAPTVICPQDQVVPVDDNCEIVLDDYRGRSTPDDNCSTPAEITLTQTPAPGTVFSGEATIVPVTIVAEDQSGNRDSCTFTVELDDVTPPAITNCQVDTIGVLDGQCDYVLPDYWDIGPATAQDNCRPSGTAATTGTGDQIVYTQTPPPGTVLSDAFTVTTITLTADDGNGNTVSCDFELTLADTTSPTIVCPADTVANPDAACDFALEDYTARAGIADNCTDADDLTVTQRPAPGTVISGDGFSQDITLTVTDPSGNQTSCTFNLMLSDTTSPTIVCPVDKVENLTADCEFTVPDYTGEATPDDNCTDPVAIMVTQQPAPGTVLVGQNEGDTFTVTLTADDGNGNTMDCGFTVTLDDAIPPAIVCPPDSTIFVDGTCEAPLPDLAAVTTATDNCAEFSPAGGGGGITITQSPLATTVYNGDDTEIVVTLTADDGNGNSTDCQVTVTLQDTVSPTIVCPPAEILIVDGNCEITLPDYTVAATTADNCTTSGNIAVTQDIAPGTVFSGEGTTQTVTLTADDGNGNTTDCTVEITLDDTTDPTIVCPSTQTQFTDDSCEDDLLDYTGFGVVDDNCTSPASIVVTQQPAPGTTIDGVGTTTVTLTADDGNGNTAACSFQVVLEDDDDPAIVCPPNQEIDFGEDCSFTVPDYRGLASQSDNCVVTPLIVTQSPAIDTIIQGLGTTQEVTLTVTDNSGNLANCSFTVTTVSATPPPATATVTLAVVSRPTGSGTVDLEDAFDNAALSNLSNLDLDQNLDPGVGPFTVTYYLSLADAAAEQNAIPNEDFDPTVSGEAVIVRIEDPRTGCFELSQILIDQRTPGTSNAADSTFCSRPGETLKIDGRPQPGGQGTTIVRHEWRLIDGGRTGISDADLMQTDQQTVMVNTTGFRSGSITVEYQFFEDYGDGPVVPSVPKRVVVEVLQVGTGDFFWDGN